MVRNSLIATALIALTGTAAGMGPANAQSYLCENRISELTARLDGSAESRRHALDGLRSAALRLNAQKMDGACMETAQALDAALLAYAAGVRGGAERAPTSAAPGASGMIVPVPRFGDIDQRALAFDDSTIDTARIQGVGVYSYTSEYLGEVSGVVLDGARPTHLILGEGGFWDAGAVLAAVPVQMLRWAPDEQVFLLPLTGQALKDAPAYLLAADDWNSDENDRYYHALPD